MFSHAFLIAPECPTALLGRGILSKLWASITMNLGPLRPLCLPLLECGIKSIVWATEDKTGRTKSTVPIKIVLKDPSVFPHQRQYPLHPNAKKGLLKIIQNLKWQKLLVPCNSPCNTPILGVQKLNGVWRLVQDLRIIHEAVVPLHPMVPNPYAVT